MTGPVSADLAVWAAEQVVRQHTEPAQRLLGHLVGCAQCPDNPDPMIDTSAECRLLQEARQLLSRPDDWPPQQPVG